MLEQEGNLSDRPDSENEINTHSRDTTAMPLNESLQCR
jgi:hypothetical protein